MKETPQEYIKRITGYIEGRQPLKVQAATPRKLERLIKGVPVSKLRKRPAPGKWSVVEILAHLADTEIVGGFRIRMILGAPGAPIAGFNQDAWVASGHYNKRDPHKSLEQFWVLREGNLVLLKSITPRTVEASRSPFRAWRRDGGAHRADVRRSRPQSRSPNRAHPRAARMNIGELLRRTAVTCWLRPSSPLSAAGMLSDTNRGPSSC